MKCHQTGEFVVGGYTPPEGSREGFGSLLLGYYEGGELIYAGRVGTGFSRRTIAELMQRLVPLRQAESPFRKQTGGPSRRSLWVKPELVAQVRLTQWTEDNSLRHPSFHGLREDKSARSAVRDAAGQERSS